MIKALYHAVTVRILIIGLALMILVYGMFFPQGTFDAVKKSL